jgi:hypothetical protein
MKSSFKRFADSIHRPVLGLMLFIACAIVLGLENEAGMAASSAGGVMTLFSPSKIAGATASDERAIDIYPAIAYDATNQRYLVVWMTLRNAQSQSAGLTVYGIFLNSTGQPVGSEFAISDSDTAARSGFPTVAAGNGEFAVAWTARGTTCQVYVQRVTDASARADRVLLSGASHLHSPSLTYNATRQRYALAFVDGDDYLPPTLFGAQTGDCGDNVTSVSRTKAMEFYFNGELPVATTPINVSDVAGGSFRPRIGYSSGLNQYLVAWEDRRNASGQANLFDVYAQRLGSTLSKTESNLQLATTGDYTNSDTSATWTPRPAVTGGGNQFLATWFTRTDLGNATIWSVIGELIPTSGETGSPFTIAEMTFAQSHAGQAPTGFLALVYSNTAQEYLLGLTNHLETYLRGYYSSARVQRVSTNGQLLNTDGTTQTQVGIGTYIDSGSDEQVSVGLAVNPSSGSSTSDYMTVYGKHAPGQQSQDLDIWGVRGRVPASGVKSIFLPLVRRR